MTRDFFVAVDGGGTRTRVVVVDEHGTEVARHEAGTSNAAVIGHAQAGAVLNAAVSSALSAAGLKGPATAAWFGLAGGDRPADHALLIDHIRQLAGEIRMTNDAELALGALPEASGIVLIAGTGSIAFGANRLGARARAGGWGHVFGDDGSGYGLARSMFDAVAREADGIGPKTSLSGKLASHWNLDEPHDLISRVYAPGMSKGDLAAVATLVLDAWGEGDTVAVSIVEEGASELAKLAVALVEKLELDAPIPLAYSGSLLIHAPSYRDLVVKNIQAAVGEVDTRPADDPALSAAVSLACRRSLTRGADGRA